MYLPVCMYVYHILAVPSAARRGSWILWNWNGEVDENCHVGSGNWIKVFWRAASGHNLGAISQVQYKSDWKW